MIFVVVYFYMVCDSITGGQNWCTLLISKCALEEVNSKKEKSQRVTRSFVLLCPQSP